jgi:cytochrome c oxidase cbb3-type subunit 3/ubiquinol-cytochrome c reductase cytochrome c subunit
MPAFAQNAGGLLTEAQIDILVRGIRERWAKPTALGSDRPPAHAASLPGRLDR